MTITFADLSDLTLSASLHSEMALKLADRASLLGHPAIFYGGDIGGSGSNVKKIAIPGFGGDKMAAINDGTAATNTDLTNASCSVTVARQALMRKPTDLASGTWSFPNAGALVDALAGDMVTAARRRFMAMVCDIADSFTTVAGVTGVDFSVTNWFSGLAALQSSSAPGPFLAILEPEQLNNLQASLRAETGPLQFSPATPELMKIKGQGFAGSYMGVDIFVSSECTNDGTDVFGCVMSYGAIAYADGTMAPVPAAGSLMLPSGTKIFVELQRDAAGASTDVVGNHYVGVAKCQDLLGVTFQSDAP